MPRAFLIGDTHIALGYPNSVDKWHRVHEQYFRDFLMPLLRREVKEGDIIIHLGDLFDNRNIIPINLLNFGMLVVEEMAGIAPLHIILGNHDCWHKSSSEINTIRPFRWIPNVTIHETTRVVEFAGKKLVMMPYVERRTEQITEIAGVKGADYLFCHSDLSGARMHLTSVAHKNPDKIDVEEFKNFAKVYSGHIHIRDTHKNFKFIGNIFQMDRSDYGDQKGILALDVETGTEEFFANNVSPKFEKVSVLTESDMDLLDGLNFFNYIDLAVSNKLLVGNRKLRRKLEMALERGQFASISYIDDLSESAGVDPDKAEVEEVATDPTRLPQLQLEFKDYIREHILSLSYDEKVKAGMVAEYNEIVRIYGENYE
jgi:DNA repair exonuclease SbcCD nuclease subunit